MDRLFTRAEAEALLPRLSELLHDLRDQVATLDRGRATLASIPIAARANGRAGEAAALSADLTAVMSAIQETLVAIEALGVEVKDPRTGLVDFRSLRAGRIVYLCWRLGEPRILYWHDLDAGFVGRQPID